MKYLQEVLKHIYSFPEATRRFFAVLCMILAAFVLFNGWRLAVSSRLTIISDTPAIIAQGEEGLEPLPELAREALSPVEGAYESFRGVANFITPRGAPDQNKASSRFSTGETLALVASSFGHTAEKAGGKLKNGLYFLYEKSQREVIPE